MIERKAIVLDIDGVIVGSKIGLNSPLPHPDVIAKIKEAQDRGIYVTLCTGRASFCTEHVANSLGLDSFCVTDGGALFCNFHTHEYTEKHLLSKNDLNYIVNIMLENNIPITLKNFANYNFLETQKCAGITSLAKAVNTTPKYVSDFSDIINCGEVTNIVLISHSMEERLKIENILSSMNLDNVSIGWTKNSIEPKYHYAVVSSNSATKSLGILKLFEIEGISFDNALGVGDTAHDWQFMQHCKYVSAMGNATDELKELVETHGDYGYIGESVNKNGIIGILNRFMEESNA